MIIESLLGVAPFMGMRPCCSCYAYMMVANGVISDDSSTIEPGSLARPQYAAMARSIPLYTTFLDKGTKVPLAIVGSGEPVSSR